MTSAEKKHLSAVAELGCLICRMPAEIHHCRLGMGKGQRDSHFRVLPLCPTHHRGGYGIGFHGGKRIWQEKYGTEEELLLKVDEELRLMRQIWLSPVKPSPEEIARSFG